MPPPEAEAPRPIINQFLRHHGGLVRWPAGRYAGRGIDLDELRQVGYVGLVLAIRRFDPDRGAEFRTFALPTVKGEIQRHFRDRQRWIQLPRIQETKAQLADATEDLTQSLQRTPTVAELADHLELGLELVREASVADTFVLTSLDQPIGAGADMMNLGESIGVTDERFDLLIECDAARPLIAALSPRLRRLLYLRYFDDRTQAQIAAEFGISQMQVSRLLTTTLERLRAKLVDAAA